MKLAQENPHIPLGTMQKMTKERLLELILGVVSVKDMGLALRKDTIIDALNWELNQCPDIPVNYKEAGE